MHVLLSLCNEPRPPQRGALLYDFAAKSGTWIPVGADAEIMGTRGICVHDGLAYVLYTVGWWETRLSTYDVRGGWPQLLRDAVLPEVKDPHSLCVYDQRLLIASTGTDEIIAYDLRQGEPGDIAETFWRAAPGGEDTHHVNSVASDGERVVLSAFGPRSGEFWSSAQEGYIRTAGTDEMIATGLLHPHSVRLWAGNVFFTESSRQLLRASDGLSVPIGGYVRGCEITADRVLVGSNAARRISRSRGIVTNKSNFENTEGDPVGKCAIARVTLSPRVTREYFDVTAFGKEIYDICALN